MWRIAIVVCAVACGDNDKPLTPADAGTDAAVQPLTSCLDQPTDVPRPPTGALPCDLIPPGISL